MGVFENVTDQPITNVDVHDVLDEEWTENEQARGMPKWLVHTLCDSKLDAPLSSRTRLGSRHASYASDCYALAVCSLHDVEEPLSFDEAQNSKNWMAAMQSEFDALIENDKWTLWDLPPGKKAIGTKWVYKLKCKTNGEIDCYKARLVVKGYAQQKGIDYEETFAHTCRRTTVHFLCALAAHFGWDVHQSDIVTAFLNGDIFEEVYVMQPRGFIEKGQEDKVCKCHKALYGLKQSPRVWYEKADTHLVKRGFRNSPTESTLCFGVSTSGFCFMLCSSCISWLSKKQPTVATSSCEAVYRAVFTATIECVWLIHLMADLGVGQDTANTFYTDS
ncbi:hypothetical protein L7F22_044661 [Adiantum nelumboides]|nr:hypothetical protein [Adiantum nelumboides]